jgi:molybdate transport system permease protein
MNWDAINLSLRLSALVATILAVVGLPIAYWLAFSKWRGKFLIEAVVSLPLVLPPTVLGYYILVIAAPHSMVGRVYQTVFGRTLPFTFEGLVAGSVLYSLPFAVQPFAASFAAVNPRLIKASSVLGASRWRTFLKVILPLSINGILTGIVLSFAHTLGEFGVVLMVGGNIPGKTQTISIDIYDKVQALDLDAANFTAFALLVFSFLVLTSIYALNRNWSVLSKWHQGEAR